MSLVSLDKEQASILLQLIQKRIMNGAEYRSIIDVEIQLEEIVDSNLDVNAPMFSFDLLYADISDVLSSPGSLDGTWSTITVLSHNKSDAIEIAKSTLGNPPHGNTWAFRVKNITQCPK